MNAAVEVADHSYREHLKKTEHDETSALTLSPDPFAADLTAENIGTKAPSVAERQDVEQEQTVLPALPSLAITVSTEGILANNTATEWSTRHEMPTSTYMNAAGPLKPFTTPFSLPTTAIPAVSPILYK